MEPISTARFCLFARLLAAEARRRRLLAPAFRSPPRLPGVDRSIRRWPGGGATVAVRLRGRDVTGVVADMVDGVLAANRLQGTEAESWRQALTAAAQGRDQAP